MVPRPGPRHGRAAQAQGFTAEAGLGVALFGDRLHARRGEKRSSTVKTLSGTAQGSLSTLRHSVGSGVQAARQFASQVFDPADAVNERVAQVGHGVAESPDRVRLPGHRSWASLTPDTMPMCEDVSGSVQSTDGMKPAAIGNRI